MRIHAAALSSAAQFHFALASFTERCLIQHMVLHKPAEGGLEVRRETQHVILFREGPLHFFFSYFGLLVSLVPRLVFPPKGTFLLLRGLEFVLQEDLLEVHFYYYFDKLLQYISSLNIQT